MKTRILPCALMFLTLGASTAFADDVVARSADGGLWLSGGVGLMNIEAHEYVYLGANKASQLDWDTDGVVLYSVSAGADLGRNWHVKGTLQYGRGGDGHMVDYDWVPGFAVDQSLNGWSDRSIHPDTRLDQYFSGAIEIGRNLFIDESSTVSVGGGFKYTEVSWDAFGGSYIYSDGGFRDDIGTLPDGLKGISYEQRIPTIFAGLDGSTSFGRLTLSGGVKGGMTPGIDDKDNHWLTQALVFGDMKPAPVLMLNAAIDYRLTDMASIYLAGNFENVFRERGDMTSIDTSTGVSTLYRNAAGASIKTMSLQMGIRARF
mgnify:CR=1 FL=1|tara:strand:- start:13639 stop:14589 length:951 start_codon:yes stop_codon:yes gene_type:complete